MGDRVVWGEDVNLYTGEVLPDTIHAPPRPVELLEEHIRKKEAAFEASLLDRRCLSKVEFDEMMEWDSGRCLLSNIQWDDNGADAGTDYRGRHQAAPPSGRKS